MPPESASEFQDEKLHKAVTTLAERVDALESQEVKNTPQDWSDAVLRTARASEARIRTQVKELSQYLDNPEQLLAEKLESYRKEVEEITSKLPQEAKDMNIYALTSDLFSPNTAEKNTELVENTAKAKQKATERPYLFIMNFDKYLGVQNAEILLEQALRKAIDDGNESVLFENYNLLHLKPFFASELTRAFDKLKNGNPIKLFKFISGVGSVDSDFIQRPDVLSVLPKAFEDSLIENPRGINQDIHLLYSEQTWYEEALKLSFKKLCLLKRIDAFHLLVDLKNNSEFINQLYVKDQIPQLVQYVLIAAPGELMQANSIFQDLPNANEIFEEAAKSLRLDDPGIALRILYEDRGKKLPFENRDKYIQDLIPWALEKNPTSVIKYFEVYENLENAQSILDTAKKRSLVSQNLGRTPYPSPEASESALFDDRALKTVGLIERNWLPTDLSDNDFAEAAAMIARNIYLANPSLYPSEKICKAEYKRILETRESYKNVTLFSGRNIIVASHLEQWSDKSDRFGKKALTDNLKSQQGEGKEFAHYESKENTIESLKEVKQFILQKIETMATPMTFLFDGHGSPDALYLSDGQVEGLQPAGAEDINESDKTVKITVEELSVALKKRSDRIGKGKVTKDILIFSACYNHSFLRSMYDKLEASGAGKPIALGVSEFGQVGYSSRESLYGSTFFDQIIKEEKSTTLGDVWNLPYNAEMNPSLYIPSNNSPQQVAVNESVAEKNSLA